MSRRALSVISAGGGLGALARYGLSLPFAHSPWSTLLINVVGCLLIGILMATWAHRELPRLFLGTGFLGGFTTYSTYVADIHHLIADGKPLTAMAYLAGTLILALLAVRLGFALVSKSEGAR